MKKTAFQVIEKAIKNSSMTISNIMENTTDAVTLTATDGAGLTITVEYELKEADTSEDYSRLVITDECSEGNFAIMCPKRGNMSSLSACMRMAMDNIIENAEA